MPPDDGLQESAVKANATITDSLVKTSQLMAENLHRGTDSIEALSKSMGLRTAAEVYLFYFPATPQREYV